MVDSVGFDTWEEASSIAPDASGTYVQSALLYPAVAVRIAVLLFC